MDHTGEIPRSGHPVASLPSNGVQNSCRIHVNGFEVDAVDGEQLIDAINRSGIRVPHVCYHARLGPIQTCDTCMVEVVDSAGGKLVRACATRVTPEMTVV